MTESPERYVRFLFAGPFLVMSSDLSGFVASIFAIETGLFSWSSKGVPLRFDDEMNE